jgi:ADP-dependent NAD(P)H-hydrate dehydratase
MCPLRLAEASGRDSADEPVVAVDAAVLHRHALPSADDVTNKTDRGQVLIVGGSVETPGGVLLAGLAALRAGAGRVQVATVESITAELAARFPEARVTPLPQTTSGAISPDAAPALAAAAERSDAVLIGSGATDPESTAALLEGLAAALPPGCKLVVDAAALPRFATTGLAADVCEDLLLLPNPGEMAALLDVEFEQVERDPVAALGDAVTRFGATVALRDTATWIGQPGSPVFRDGSGNPALATSGSGDVLAGCVAGLAARGAVPLAAVLWGVHAHGCAGDRLAAHYGGPGLLARELVDRLPRELNALT